MLRPALRLPRSLASGLLATLVLASSATLTATGPAAFAATGTAGDALTSLTLRAESDAASYSRDAFEHWVDADGDGCDTRAEVLIAESRVPVARSSGCRVTAGEWLSYYDGATWTDASDVDVEHVVALAEAWQSGASRWDDTERRDFANDLTIDYALEAVADNVNQSKGSGDVAEWLPPSPEVACRYVTATVLVRYRWQLSIDPAERDAVRRVLATDGCGQRVVELPDRARQADPEPAPDPTPSPTGPPAPAARSTDRACPPGGVPEDGFTDVPASSPHEASVDCLVWWRVAAGRSATSYAPAAGVTRAQMATFIANTVTQSGGTLPAPGRDFFADDDGNIHERNVNRLAAAGIVAGRGDGSYGPDGPVTRDAMATFLAQALEYRTGSALPSQGDAFGDDDGNVHEPNIDRAAAAGLTGGSNGRYNPAGQVTREQMGSFIARSLDLLVEGGQATEVPPSTRPEPLTPTPPPAQPQPTPPPEQERPAKPGDNKNCGDFARYSDAKAYFDFYYPHYGDVARLDRDGDLIPCESLPGAP